MRSKQAISLIVLVITIIVMIILAGSIILTLSNNGIINKSSEAVEKSDEATVKTIVQTYWAEAYSELKAENNKITKETLEYSMFNKLEEANINTDGYSIKVSEKGASVVKSVLTIVDGVPIPKGFVASRATGENTKLGGLVIYEGTEPVTDENVATAKKERNQYVWVPVHDFSKFVRSEYAAPIGGLDSDSAAAMPNSNKIGTVNSNWEVALDTTTNMPLIEQNMNFMTTTTLKEVQEMYKSVKQYKGFYVARYEAGLDVGSHKTIDDGVIIKQIHSKMNKAPYNYVRWTYNYAMNQDTKGAVEIARSLYEEYNENYGVVSTLIYGVQWDRILAWWIETKAQNGTKDITIQSTEDLRDSELYGNYRNSEISSFNEGAKYLLYDYTNKKLDTKYEDISSIKSKDTSWLLTTGATEETRINNIYDMAGNLWEWTMEGNSNDHYNARGATYQHSSSKYPVSYRSNASSKWASCYRGFRTTLYIKPEFNK